jgi:hypothetical protein
MAQEITGVTAAVAAGMVGMISITNGGAVSLGLVFGSRGAAASVLCDVPDRVVFWLMTAVTNFSVFTLLVFIICPAMAVISLRCRPLPPIIGGTLCW